MAPDPLAQGEHVFRDLLPIARAATEICGVTRWCVNNLSLRRGV